MNSFDQNRSLRLLRNGLPANIRNDHIPVVKLFIKGTGQVWLISLIWSENERYGYGLIDLNDGEPRLGVIDLEVIQNTEAELGITIEVDENFVGKYPISAYASAAKLCGRFVEKDLVLRKCHALNLANNQTKRERE
jgi:hypothetical protein